MIRPQVNKVLHPLLPALLLIAGLCSSPATAGEQAERALAGVRKLLGSGEIMHGTTLRLGFKQGNVNAFLGRDLELQREWEDKTGTLIRAKIVPQQPSWQLLKESGDIDLTVARNHEYPDLVGDSLITDLTPLLAEFGFSLDNNPKDGLIRPELQSFYGDRVVAVPADGDVAMLYLRRDLLEDPAEQTAFRAAYGRPLAVPETWREYEQLQQFFHRPAQDLYGVAEERDEEGAWMYWFPRYASAAAPYHALFDAQMRPLIDSAEGVAATESYVASVRYSPPGITESGNGYSFALPIFARGKAFATMSTVAGARLFNGEGSVVRGRFIAAPMPGNRIGGKLVRRNTIMYGNNLVVAQSGNRKLAFLYAMWLTDPDVSLRSVGVTGGFADPYRHNHLQHERIRNAYTPQALQVFLSEWAVALPAGTGLRGDREYLAALDRNLTRAARGEIGAQEAMARTAAEWDAITDRYGRAEQRRELKKLLSLDAVRQ